MPDGASARLLDLPGLYSLTPHSPDEVIAREVLMGLRDDTPRPDVILNVVDASNLERNLYLTSQLLDIGLPVVIALTMTDTLDKEGTTVHARRAGDESRRSGLRVVASRKQGLDALLAALRRSADMPAASEPAWHVPAEIAERDRRAAKRIGAANTTIAPRRVCRSRIPADAGERTPADGTSARRNSRIWYAQRTRQMLRRRHRFRGAGHRCAVRLD